MNNCEKTAKLLKLASENPEIEETSSTLKNIIIDKVK